MAKTTAPEPATEPAKELDLTALANSEEHTVTPGEVNVPEQIKAFVDAGHQAWQTKPKTWRAVTLANAEAVKYVTTHARAYGRATGRTFRVNKKATTDTRLVYKVTDKFQNHGQEDASDE